MKTKTSILIIICLFLSGCEVKPSLIEGKWQRFDNVQNNAIVEVTKSAQDCKGVFIEANGLSMVELGFKAGDVKWKNIKQISDYEYIALDLTHYTDKKRNVEDIKYDSISIEMLTNDLIKIKPYNKVDIKSPLDIQKWRRLLNN